MKKRFWRKNSNHVSDKGFTLVEVLITVAIVAIIMGVMGTLFFSGANAYNDGSKKAFAQNDTRLGMELIQNEVRHAKALNLIGGNFNPETNGDASMSYIVFKLTKENIGKITIYSRSSDGGFVQMTLPGDYKEKAVFKVIDKDNPDLTLLGISLAGNYQGSDFELETSINLLNMSNSSKKDISGLEESSAIEYLK